VKRTADDATDYDRATKLETACMLVIELVPSDWKALAA
jgi:hypothetical protein